MMDESSLKVCTVYVGQHPIFSSFWLWLIIWSQINAMKCHDYQLKSAATWFLQARTWNSASLSLLHRDCKWSHQYKMTVPAPWGSLATKHCPSIFMLIAKCHNCIVTASRILYPAGNQSRRNSWRGKHKVIVGRQLEMVRVCFGSFMSYLNVFLVMS